MESLSLDRYHFYFLVNLKGNANIAVVIKAGSAVFYNTSVSVFQYVLSEKQCWS